MVPAAHTKYRKAEIGSTCGNTQTCDLSQTESDGGAASVRMSEQRDRPNRNLAESGTLKSRLPASQAPAPELG